MAIKIKGIEFDKDFSFNIKEQDIKKTVVKIPQKYYQASAAFETIYGSVEITGSTLHGIIQELLIQNKPFRAVITDFIDELEGEDKAIALSTLH
tara:strand:+ start:43 stop:324 length:282 start_codon:yes stop_codon:yes gene_type:complete